MDSINVRAQEIVQQMVRDADALNLSVSRLENGAMVVAAGNCQTSKPGSV